MTLYQVNSDLGFVQSGSEGVSSAGLVLGARSGQATFVSWKELRESVLNNNTNFVSYFDDFVGAAVSSRIATDLSASCTFTINAQSGGVARALTTATDDDHATVALGLNWKVSNGYTFFSARVKSVTAATLRAIEIGLSDAVSETAGLAFSTHVVGAPTAVATNAVVFGYDTDGSMTTWAALNSNADAETSVDTGITVDASWHEYAITVDSAGNAYFYIDDVLTNTIELAVATTAVLTPWISLKSLSAAIKTVDIDYISISGTRV